MESMIRRGGFLFLVLPLAGVGEHDAEIEAFRAFARARMEIDGTPGMSIGFRKGEFRWVEGFGFADVENRVPAKAESAYRLASVTKPMTAAAVLELVEQGKIDLDAEVQAYVPYFPRKSAPVTVRQLLGHLGGISHYRDYDLEGHFKDPKDTREAIAVFADFDLVAEPGTRFSYSSYGYNLLGAVVEGASGKPYGEFMREAVWGPLGMESTRMDDPHAIIPNRVRGYRRGADGRIENSEFVDISSRFAAGGTRSTVHDMLDFADVLRPGKVLSAESIDAMLDSMATREGRSVGYGMGWGVGARNGRFLASHSGGQAETSTYLVCFPYDDFAIAIGMNFEGGDHDAYVARLYELVMKEPYLPRPYLPDPVEDRLFDAVQSAFDSGLTRARRGAAAPSDDEAEAAFAYFDEAMAAALVEEDRAKASARIRDGHHPFAGEPFAKVGAYMVASLLGSRKAGLEDLRRGGPARLFSRYVTLYREGRSVPEACRFAAPFEELVSKWTSDWDRVWDGETRALDLRAAADLGAIAPALERKFAGSSIVPNFWPVLSEIAKGHFVRGDLPKATKVADLAASLYPSLDETQVYAGLARLAGGKPAEASAAFRRAIEIDPNGAASARALNALAYEMKGIGQRDFGLALLRAAVEIHPAVANLHDSVGEFLLEKGDRGAAIAAYRKALEIDPDLATAKAALRKISAQ